MSLTIIVYQLHSVYRKQTFVIGNLEDIVLQTYPSKFPRVSKSARITFHAVTHGECVNVYGFISIIQTNFFHDVFRTLVQALSRVRCIHAYEMSSTAVVFKCDIIAKVYVKKSCQIQIEKFINVIFI